MAAALLAATGMFIAPTPAQAGMNCFGGLITINAGPGGEAPSTATGHAHSDTNHYVHHTYNRNWVWYSDNSTAGFDGPDTYYGTIAC
ncbi:hypothetical protein [Micromonospora carbonacea]|uniref:hypothetical protein n=1 Tax=Micromonospora carbonacea TaxID=47853 RepID=UPI003D72CAC1